MVSIPDPFLTAFPPSRCGLLETVRELVDEEMLGELAGADYGVDAEEHLAALRPIRNGSPMPVPLPWHPKEVLDLMRWSEPDDPSWEPGVPGERGHRIRAFACATLLTAACDPGNRDCFDGENTTLVQMTSSALVLGPRIQQSLASFLTWRIPTLHADEECPFFAFALLLLAAVMRAGRLSDDALVSGAEWVLAVEAAERAEVALYSASDRWLLGLTHFDQRHGAWRSMAARLGAEAADLASPIARSRLSEIAHLLTHTARDV